jgi:anti-sigma factor RsiW
MDTRDERILRLLCRYLDAPLRKRQQARLDRALARSAELRRQKDEIVAIRTALAGGSVGGFRPGFADRVLARVRSAEVAPDRLESLARVYAAVFRRIAAVGLIAVALLVVFNLVQGDLVPRDAIFYASNLAAGGLLRVPIF